MIAMSSAANSRRQLNEIAGGAAQAQTVYSVYKFCLIDSYFGVVCGYRSSRVPGSLVTCVRV